MAILRHFWVAKSLFFTTFLLKKKGNFSIPSHLLKDRIKYSNSLTVLVCRKNCKTINLSNSDLRDGERLIHGVTDGVVRFDWISLLYLIGRFKEFQV